MWLGSVLWVQCELERSKYVPMGVRRVDRTQFSATTAMARSPEQTQGRVLRLRVIARRRT